MGEEKEVLPGTELGTEEEYSPGRGTYLENGKIYAALAGKLLIKERTLEVKQKSLLLPLQPGAVVLGIVREVIESIAVVSIISLPTENVRYTKASNFCILPASGVKRGFVWNIHAEMKIGDIIKAKVAEIREGEILLTTAEPQLGVIKAYCVSCRRPLKLSGGVLVCEECGRKEYRKLSSEYRNF